MGSGTVRSDDEYPHVGFAKKMAREKQGEIVQHIDDRLAKYNKLANSYKYPLTAAASFEIDRRAKKLQEMKGDFNGFWLSEEER